MSADPRTPKFLFSRVEAAEALRICPRTLDAKVKAGEIAHVRIGRHVNFRVEDIRQIIDANLHMGEPVGTFG